jgi:hypothetical protein
MHIVEQARQLNCRIEEIAGGNFACHIAVSFYFKRESFL